MTGRDKYRSFRELALKQREGHDYRIRFENRHSRILVMTPHGGRIEPGTSEIVEAVSANDMSYYMFEGIRPKGNYALHIKSTGFDEPEAMELLRSCDIAVTFHGESSEVEMVYIGGRDKTLRPHLEKSLKEAGFETQANAKLGLAGISNDNICNRCLTNKGVQLELSRGLRESLFTSLNEEKVRRTQKFYQFVNAVRAGIEKVN